MGRKWKRDSSSEGSAEESSSASSEEEGQEEEEEEEPAVQDEDSPQQHDSEKEEVEDGEEAGGELTKRAHEGGRRQRIWALTAARAARSPPTPEVSGASDDEAAAGAAPLPPPTPLATLLEDIAAAAGATAEQQDDLLVCWDFLQVLGAGDTPAFTASLASDVDGADDEDAQAWTTQQAAHVAVSSGTTNPLGLKGTCPSLQGLYRAVTQPDRGWLDTVQVRLVDMLQHELVRTLEAAAPNCAAVTASTTRPNALTWPEFARQALGNLTRLWRGGENPEASMRAWLRGQHDASSEHDVLVAAGVECAEDGEDTEGRITVRRRRMAAAESDALVVAVTRRYLEWWRARHTALVEEENRAALAHEAALALQDAPASSWRPTAPPGADAGEIATLAAAFVKAWAADAIAAALGKAAGAPPLTKYGRSAALRFLSSCSTTSRTPEWAATLLLLLPIPAKNSKQVRDKIQAAAAAAAVAGEQAVAQALEVAVSDLHFRSNSATASKELALEVLVDWLVAGHADSVTGIVVAGDEDAEVFKATAIAEGGDQARTGGGNETEGGGGRLRRTGSSNASGRPPSRRGKGGVEGDGGRGSSGGATEEMEIEEGPREIDCFKPLLMRRCRALIRYLATRPNSMAFHLPVDTRAFPDYLEYVSRPIDFRTIDRKLAAGAYRSSLKLFARDVRLLWRNARAYNAGNGPLLAATAHLSAVFERLFQKWILQPWKAFAEAGESAGSDDGRHSSDGLEQRLNGEALGGLRDKDVAVLLDRVPWSEGCLYCGLDGDPRRILLCDGCEREAHMGCLEPPLKEVPVEDWYCSECSANSRDAIIVSSNENGNAAAHVVRCTPADMKRVRLELDKVLECCMGPATILQSVAVPGGGAVPGGNEATAAASVFVPAFDVTSICRALVRSVAHEAEHSPFLEPVNLKLVPAYATAIRSPIDLRTIDRRIEAGHYGGVHPGGDAEPAGDRSDGTFVPFQHEELYKDLKRVSRNAQRFNVEHSEVWLAAEHLRQSVDRLYRMWVLSPLQGKSEPPGQEIVNELLAKSPPWWPGCVVCGEDEGLDEDVVTAAVAASPAVEAAAAAVSIAAAGVSSAAAPAAVAGSAAAAAAVAVADAVPSSGKKRGRPPGSGSKRAGGGSGSDTGKGGGVECASCRADYHMRCLSPPLLERPPEPWTCPKCLTGPEALEALRRGKAEEGKVLIRKRSAGELLGNSGSGVLELPLLNGGKQKVKKCKWMDEFLRDETATPGAKRRRGRSSPTPDSVSGGGLPYASQPLPAGDASSHVEGPAWQEKSSSIKTEEQAQASVKAGGNEAAVPGGDEAAAERAVLAMTEVEELPLPQPPQDPRDYFPASCEGELLGALVGKMSAQHGVLQGVVCDCKLDAGSYLVKYPLDGSSDVLTAEGVRAGMRCLEEMLAQVDVTERVSVPSEEKAPAAAALTSAAADVPTRLALGRDLVDPAVASVLKLLRRKNYPALQASERLRLLRLLCDLCAATGPVKERLQLLSGRHDELKSAMAVMRGRLMDIDGEEAAAAGTLMTQEGEGASGRKKQNLFATECPHTDRKRYGRGMCVSCYQKWLKARSTNVKGTIMAGKADPDAGAGGCSAGSHGGNSGGDGAGASARAAPSVATAAGGNKAIGSLSPPPPGAAADTAAAVAATPEGQELSIAARAARDRRAARAAEEAADAAERALRRQQLMLRLSELREWAAVVSPTTQELGTDRHGSVYYLFRGDQRAVYVLSGKRGSWAVYGGSEAVLALAQALSRSPLRREKRLARRVEETIHPAAAFLAGKSAATSQRPLPCVQGSTATGIAKHGKKKQKQQHHQQVPLAAPSPPAWSFASRSLITMAVGDGPSAEAAEGSAAGAAMGLEAAVWPPCVLRQAGGPRAGSAPCSACCGSCVLYAALSRSNRQPDGESLLVTPAGGEGCGSGDEGEAGEVKAARKALLTVAAAVPVAAWKPLCWDTVSFLTWRAFVRHATTPRALLQALLVLENNVDAAYLAEWWKAWRSPTAAMRLATSQAVAFRVYVLDAALLYEARARVAVSAGSGGAGSKKARGRPSSKKTTAAAAAASTPFRGNKLLWKGLHGDLCKACSQGGSLLCCDYCSSAYHLSCLDLALEPSGLWACPECQP